MKSTLLYALLVLLSLLAGLANEQLAYAIFFFSSVFFTASIVYGTWKETRPLKEIEYPAGKDVFSQRGLDQLSAAVQNTVSGKSSSAYVLSRLRHILLKKMSLRLGITEHDAEELLQNSDDLEDLGYSRPLALMNERHFLNRTRNERAKLLNDILDQLEEN
jgi:hypothetical protein